MNKQTHFYGYRWINRIVVLTFGFALALGASFLLIPLPFAPLIILAGLIGCIFLFFCLRKPVLALYLAIFVVLLPRSLIPDEINSILNRIAAMLALGVWVIELIKNKQHIIFTLSTGLMLSFIIWSAMSLTWGANQEEGLTVVQTYALRFILFIFLISNEIKTKNDLEWLMNILALSGLLLVLVSLGFIIRQGYIPGTRLQVLEVNENELGINLLITVPGVLWWAMRPSKQYWTIKKGLAGLFLLLVIALTGFSGSRGSAISLGITLIALLIWKRTRPWGIFSVIIIGLILILIPSIFTTTIERFLGRYPGESPFGGREFIWPAGMILIKEHMLTGVGIGNSSSEIISYMLKNGAPWIKYNPVPLHNPVMVIWAETGFPGLLLYLGVLISAIFSFIFEYIRTKKIGFTNLLIYFELVAAMTIGYLVSWIKGGGMETSFSYFLVLSLLIIPTVLIKSQSKIK
jgi:putative inorganic carbon (HCO3(-)) transporter